MVWFVEIKCSTCPGKCSLSDIIRILKPRAQPSSLSRSDLIEPINGFCVSAVIYQEDESSLRVELEEAGALAIYTSPVSNFVIGKQSQEEQPIAASASGI